MAVNWNHSVISRAWGERGIERLASLVNVLLLLALSYTLAQFTWALWPTPVSVQRPMAVASAAPGSAPAAMTSFADIANWHLFGKYEAVANTPPPVAGPPPETPLNLTLRGVIASNNRADARAIIADQSGKESHYGMDAELPGGALLKEIHADHIILSRNNQNETLSLPKNPSDGPPAGGLPADTSLPSPLPTAPSGDLPEDAAIGTPEIGPDTVGEPDPGIVPPPEGALPEPAATPGAPGAAEAAGQDDIGALLRNYRDALAANPTSLIGLVQTEPVMEGDKFLGYRVQPGSDPTLFQRAGLQPGDVVTAVNGIVLDDPAKGAQVVTALAAASTISLAVNRNGEAKSVSLSITE